MTVAALVAVSLPLGYALTAFGDITNSLSFKARVKASALETMIAANPRMWMFAENRMQGLIEREPVPLEGELVQIFDADNHMLVQGGSPHGALALSQSHSLFDGNRVAGQIRVSASVVEIVYRTMGVALVGVILAALVFLVMRVFPLRALRRATGALIEEKERAETTLRSISDAVSTIDETGNVQQINPAGLAMLEASSAESLIGQPMVERVAPEYRAEYLKLHQRVLAGEAGEMQYETVGLLGGRRWLETSAVPFHDHGQVVQLAVTRDVTERKHAEEEINHLAFFDQLTSLPNRRLLLDRMGQAMSASARTGAFAALLFIDLDRFKAVNDVLGHAMGDSLLIQVAQRLTANLRLGDTVARLGGDEFVVMLANLDPSMRAAAIQTEGVGEKLHNTLDLEYDLGGQPCRCTSSIGVTLFSGPQVSADALLRQADLAMYKAKEEGRDRVYFFDPELETALATRTGLERDLRVAVRDQQFVLHYQAQFSDARLTGAEALVRWQHPTRGLVSPGEFIPLAEETGLIVPLGRWVLETACRQIARWSGVPGLDSVTVAVNVSIGQFQQQTFVDDVLAVLDETRASALHLKLELTESMLAAHVDEVVAKMLALKARGVSFSLDDFGTGYSSLSYLKRLPLDQLKIDKSFVDNVDHDPSDAAIAKTIVTLGDSLGLTVIAEGVETAMQRDCLAAMGCHGYQGYFFSRPLALEKFEELVRQLGAAAPL